MLDPEEIRAVADAPPTHPEILGAEGVVVTRAFLRQAASELEEGRAAKAELELRYGA